MDNESEILRILQEIQMDMRSLDAKKLAPKEEEPVVAEIEIEAEPVSEEEMTKGIEPSLEDVEEEEEDLSKLPRWKQRQKQGM